jgi:hypothetical protein
MNDASIVLRAATALDWGAIRALNDAEVPNAGPLVDTDRDDRYGTTVAMLALDLGDR